MSAPEDPRSIRAANRVVRMLSAAREEPSPDRLSRIQRRSRAALRRWGKPLRGNPRRKVQKRGAGIYVRDAAALGVRCRRGRTGRGRRGGGDRWPRSRSSAGHLVAGLDGIGGCAAGARACGRTRASRIAPAPTPEGPTEIPSRGRGSGAIAACEGARIPRTLRGRVARRRPGGAGDARRRCAQSGGGASQTLSPRGSEEEREVLAISALGRLGRSDGARQRAVTFLHRFPRRLIAPRWSVLRAPPGRSADQG